MPVWNPVTVTADGAKAIRSVLPPSTMTRVKLLQSILDDTGKVTGSSGVEQVVTVVEPLLQQLVVSTVKLAGTTGVADGVVTQIV